MPRTEIRPQDTTFETMAPEGIEGQLEQILQQIRRRARGVRGSVIADSNGLTVAGDIHSGVSASVLAAMSTLIAQSAGGVFENLDMPGPDFILMEGPQSNVMVMHLPAGDVTLLALLEKSTNLGVLKIEMERASRGIGDVLGFAPAHRSSISELFVLAKSGVLIRHYSDSLRTDLDRDALGGMLVAVQQFCQQTLAAKPGSLDQLRYGHYTIFFVRAIHTVAAAVAKDGDVENLKYQVSDALQDFEDRFSTSIESWDGDVGAFPGIDACFDKILKG